MKTKIALTVTLLALAGAFLYTNNTVFAQTTPPPASGQEDEQHVLIRRAMHALGQAKTDLQMAKHDFGGHRVAAIKACDQALNECKQAMAFDKK
jgi:uncharacterized membrane protein